ncbi:hypothetical protein ACOSP7_019591 [Xanthoceras sorbifolium]
MRKHCEFLGKKVSFHLLLLSLSLLNFPHLNQFLAIWPPPMIMMRIFLPLSTSQTRITILQPVLLFSLIKSFQMEDRNLALKPMKFLIGKQKMPGHRIES